MYIVQDYIFTPGVAGAGTIEIPAILKLEDFGTITNVSKGSILYDPAEGNAGATVSYVAGTTILTLEQSTTYCQSTDDIQIQVLGGDAPPSEVRVVNTALDPVPVTGPLTDTQLRATSVPVSGTVTSQVAVRTPTTTSVASSATSVTILAANVNRKGFSISNISTSKLYLSFANPATTANCFIEVPAGAFLLLDQQLIVGSAIYGIWVSANGTVQVTEFV